MVQSVNTANENAEYSPLAATQRRLLNYELGTCTDDVRSRYSPPTPMNSAARQGEMAACLIAFGQNIPDKAEFTKKVRAVAMTIA
ncbi:hypothetical protein TrLO_g9277 [Triparma laevis f. longispina]|uniref:Uncharacterized protein n=1 Tax=Triparma laevis f. longispina TaxID=1714387 RepID=A0A9W7KYG4_9STRA|nr:hypothetical protein TrLO_g9277 [Triparma laevis f. longispina]